MFRELRQFDRAGIAEERSDQIDVPFDRMPRRNRQGGTVEPAGEFFPRRGKSDDRTALRQKGEERAPGQPLKVEDEIVPLAAQVADQTEEFRQHGAALPQLLPLEEDRFRNRPRTVVENPGERRCNQKIQLRFREAPVQLRQRRKQVDDIPQTARLDDQNAFDSSGVDHGFGPLAVTSRRQDGAPAAPAAPRR